MQYLFLGQSILKVEAIINALALVTKSCGSNRCTLSQTIMFPMVTGLKCVVGIA